MTRASHIFVTTAVALLLASPAYAQRPEPLRSPADAARFCTHSAPRLTTEPRSTGEKEAYDAQRRRTAQRPIDVWLIASAAPVIEYDRVTGSLEFSVYNAAKFADGYALTTNIGTVGFELPEADAHTLRARYEAGTASLKITFLPLAWSDYDRPLCRTESEMQVLDGEVLSADLVDEVGRSIARFHTRLGREVALMRQHRIKGYLDTGTPVVTVSALTPYPRGETTLGDDTQARIRSDLRAMLYGCYLKGLAGNGRLQGALVVKITDTEATVLVDSLHDQMTRGCALDRIASLPRDRRSPSLKATVIFRLEEAPSL